MAWSRCKPIQEQCLTKTLYNIPYRNTVFSRPEISETDALILHVTLGANSRPPNIPTHPSGTLRTVDAERWALLFCMRNQQHGKLVIHDCSPGKLAHGRKHSKIWMRWTGFYDRKAKNNNLVYIAFKDEFSSYLWLRYCPIQNRKTCSKIDSRLPFP